MRYTVFLVAATALAAPVPQMEALGQVGQLMYNVPMVGPMVAGLMGGGQGAKGNNGGMMGMGNMFGLGNMMQGMPIIGNFMGGGNGAGMGSLMNMNGLLGGAAPAAAPAPAKNP